MSRTISRVLSHRSCTLFESTPLTSFHQAECVFFFEISSGQMSPDQQILVAHHCFKFAQCSLGLATLKHLITRLATLKHLITQLATFAIQASVSNAPQAIELVVGIIEAEENLRHGDSDAPASSGLCPMYVRHYASFFLFKFIDDVVLLVSLSAPL
jgi:hypothetical protein